MRVLITGGTGSVGMELIRLFSASKQYDITFTYYSNVERAKRLVEKYNCSATTIDQIDNSYDIIVNCAGIVNSLAPIEEIEEEKWEEALRVNLTIPFLIIKKNLPYMKEKHWGRIINIASIYGVCAEEDVTPYSVSKEYAQYGITCNAVCPATIASEMSDRIADFYSHTEEERNEYFKALCDSVPAKRLVYPDEVAEFVYFLCGNKAGYINGATLMIDGGYTV